MNAKMKVLSLALVGLCGYAGSALAVCPAGPDIANGGAWTAVSQFQGAAVIATPGLATTECRLDSSINAGAGGAAQAVVQDDSPAGEQRYRAQFIIKLDTLATPSITTSAGVFSGASNTGAGINLGIFGNSGQWFLSYIVPDANEPSGFFAGSTPLTAGENHVEFDLQVGGTGSVTLWVNNNVEATPTITPHPVNNTATVGIDTAYMGLAAPTAQFVTAYATQAAQYDQFDSRRQTFIGY